MSIPMIVFVVAYVAVTIAYLFSETSGNFKRRAINKIFLASMFLIYAIVELIHYKTFGTIQMICMLGVFFAFLGDVLLLWDFVKGGTSFCIGNIFFIVYLNLYLRAQGFDFSDFGIYTTILVAIPVVAETMLIYKNNWFPYLKDKLKPSIVFYILTVTIQGMLGLVSIFLMQDIKTLLLGLGLALFMVSDYFIIVHKFKNKESKLILRCNSSTYFIGLMLVALSFSF